MKLYLLVLAVLMLSGVAVAQDAVGTSFKLVLSDHKGQLSWTADGFKITQSSAKANGREIGIRGEDSPRRISFLGFLFLAADGETLTSGKCRDDVLTEEKKEVPSLKVSRTTELVRGNGPPVSLVTYTTKMRDGSTGSHVRGFIASNDICGDLEIYSGSAIDESDAEVAKIFATYQFDASYVPKFYDVARYGLILYEMKMYQAAGPTLEKALTMVSDDGSPFPSAKIARRVLTDQAGMSYGISGNLDKARSIFEAASAKDPDYPLYYYNLACADAQAGRLSDARKHLQEAFARKANVIPGEAMPDPTTDDSFLPYKENKEFWDFVEHLQEGK